MEERKFRTKNRPGQLAGENPDLGGGAGVFSFFISNMVNSAYPIPDGFTESEVFTIGTILLVEGKMGCFKESEGCFCHSLPFQTLRMEQGRI